MREISFKAKRLDNGEWVEGYYLKYTKPLNGEIEHRIFVSDSDGVMWYVVHEDTICQFTGLTDKNGDKIWENDIVEIPKENDCFRIEWCEDQASFVMNNDSYVITFEDYWSDETEVIDNIFNNPELLENE